MRGGSTASLRTGRGRCEIRRIKVATTPWTIGPAQGSLVVRHRRRYGGLRHQRPPALGWIRHPARCAGYRVLVTGWPADHPTETRTSNSRSPGLDRASASDCCASSGRSLTQKSTAHAKFRQGASYHLVGMMCSSIRRWNPARFRGLSSWPSLRCMVGVGGGGRKGDVRAEVSVAGRFRSSFFRWLLLGRGAWGYPGRWLTYVPRCLRGTFEHGHGGMAMVVSVYILRLSCMWSVGAS
ncbi:predicted protein [Streptomyces sviceus ATCC 29083]|uniref:Uncharacterized protein n=1 Tax=Streptomyces sviceus (strain ATCC 29083 / DSM 924 / JCM 4929 / NBRC 13980 / NCIMB 11184 / NRRL 5439 / UC 5370) TaxID=463191 RepID=D6XB36_STRX2|nr:predicted protein [Streptomyces sviceus ATCC 29083]